MNRCFSRSPSYYAPWSFLGAVKAMTLIKQGRLMNWKRYREALLLTGDRPGIRVVRLIHRDSVWMNLPTAIISAFRFHSTGLAKTLRPDCTASPATQFRFACVGAPRSDSHARSWMGSRHNVFFANVPGGLFSFSSICYQKLEGGQSRALPILA
jgi:hypothetical protein